MGKDKKIKQKILNSLSGEFEVMNVEKEYLDGAICVVCSFIKNGKKGAFRYILDCGEIDYVNVDGYGEVDKDIYADIHDWVNEDIEYEIIVRHKGKELL